MIGMDLAYGLNLIALSLGTALLMWSIKSPGKGSWIGKLFGLLVMIFSIISIVCMFSCAMRGGECHRHSYGEGMVPPPPHAEGPAAPGHEPDHVKKEHKHS